LFKKNERTKTLQGQGLKEIGANEFATKWHREGLRATHHISYRYTPDPPAKKVVEDTRKC
jgi:hypothetical protein